jgi:hypothetical protein
MLIFICWFPYTHRKIASKKQSMKIQSVTIDNFPINSVPLRKIVHQQNGSSTDKRIYISITFGLWIFSYWCIDKKIFF